MFEEKGERLLLGGQDSRRHNITKEAITPTQGQDSSAHGSGHSKTERQRPLSCLLPTPLPVPRCFPLPSYPFLSPSYPSLPLRCLYSCSPSLLSPSILPSFFRPSTSSLHPHSIPLPSLSFSFHYPSPLLPPSLLPPPCPSPHVSLPPLPPLPATSDHTYQFPVDPEPRRGTAAALPIFPSKLTCRKSLQRAWGKATGVWAGGRAGYW